MPQPANQVLRINSTGVKRGQACFFFKLFPSQNNPRTLSPQRYSQSEGLLTLSHPRTGYPVVCVKPAAAGDVTHLQHARWRHVHDTGTPGHTLSTWTARLLSCRNLVISPRRLVRPAEPPVPIGRRLPEHDQNIAGVWSEPKPSTLTTRQCTKEDSSPQCC